MAVAALIIGASGGVSALLLAGWRKPVDREFTVSVFLDADIDAAQKAAVRAELEKLPSRDGVSFESREQAFANFKEIWKDQPERIA